MSDDAFREECMANAYESYLNALADTELAQELKNTMNQLSGRQGEVKEFVRKEWLVQTIQELDYTGEHSKGFFDIRKEI